MYLQYEDKDVVSSDIIYNDNSQDITTLYSGLLKEKVVDKICVNGTFSTPEIPEELKNCVRNKDIIDDGFLRSFEFTLINPENEETSTLVSAPVVEDGQCPVSSKKHFLEETQTSETKVGLIVFFAALLFLLLIFATTVACHRCYQKKKRRKEETRSDENPTYDGADYEYDEMTDFDNVEVSTTRRREVKAEVVDRSSIYGEEEEGWEGAVVVDNNTYYED